MIDRKPPAADVPYVGCDLADTDAVASAVESLAGKVGGRITGVFTPAGIDSCGTLEQVPAKDWEQVIAVNLVGTAAVIRAALPYLKATGGRIVTCASTLGIKAVSDATAYCASKFGVVGFTRALAAELAGQVGVTLLIPGGMHTPFFDGRPRLVQAAGRRQTQPARGRRPNGALRALPTGRLRGARDGGVRLDGVVVALAAGATRAGPRSASWCCAPWDSATC